MTLKEIEDIFSIKPENETGFMFSIALFKKHNVGIELKENFNTDNKLYYRVHLDEVMASDITQDEMVLVRNSKWEITEDKEYLILNLR
jgi:hypothetical protein